MIDKDNVKSYFNIINKTPDIDDELLTFCIDETVDRLCLYLNLEEADLSSRLERVVANIVNSLFKMYSSTIDSAEIQQGIESMSDNGQSVSFKDGIMNYFVTSDDSAYFQGYTSLLKIYRRVGVVGYESQSSI